MHGGADAQLQPCLAHGAHGPDMRVSADWYQRVLGFEFVKEFQVAPGDAGIPRILLLHQRSGFLLGLCDHPGRSDDAFDPRRTGLDHIAFEVADRAELAS
jgi:glyoxylase I family protein